LFMITLFLTTNNVEAVFFPVIVQVVTLNKIQKPHRQTIPEAVILYSLNSNFKNCTLWHTYHML
jgi:hypothetical protein